MEGNEKCSVTSTIEHSCIGTVINGDVEMQCPVFNLGANPPQAPAEDLAEMKEERAINRELLRRARLWRSAQPLLTAVITMVMLSELARYKTALNELEWLVSTLMVCAVPLVAWLVTPRWLKERHRMAKRTIKKLVPELDELESRIAYLEARERHRNRRRNQ